MDSEENIIKKIIELNFDENIIKDYYIVLNLYNELDVEYGFSAFIERDAMLDKIRELHCDKNLIAEWIENTLLNV